MKHVHLRPPTLTECVMIPSILTMRRATNCWDREAGQSNNYDADQVNI